MLGPQDSETFEYVLKVSEVFVCQSFIIKLLDQYYWCINILNRTVETAYSDHSYSDQRLIWIKKLGTESFLHKCWVTLYFDSPSVDTLQVISSMSTAYQLTFNNTVSADK